jgi:hypothetical protein
VEDRAFFWDCTECLIGEGELPNLCSKIVIFADVTGCDVSEKVARRDHITFDGNGGKEDAHHHMK